MSRDIINRQQNVDPDHLRRNVQEVLQKGDKSSNRGFSSKGLRRAEDYNVGLREGVVDPVQNNRMKLDDSVQRMREEGLQVNLTKLLKGEGVEFMPTGE